MNEVKISGYIREKLTKVMQFDSGKILTDTVISVYNGKDKNGKNQYSLLSVKYWGDIPSTKAEVVFEGYLKWDMWEKEGKKQSKLYLLANNVIFEPNDVEETTVESKEDLEDEIPF